MRYRSLFNGDDDKSIHINTVCILILVTDSRDVRDSPVYLSPEFRKKAMRQKLGGMYKPVEKSFKEKSSVADDFCNTQ